ncbi:PTS sugar transporter subunit IIA [Nocardioides mesophilus]|uniref:Mannitol-specific phosphotransferase enzyme IIA component n=1 Tax=Nocardioides mesophilus TaxID=433659 RepID=A0A7G9RDA7_9ACTN|nr:PTS sugar transporter subunit IIA [Nocardioides mesophilus]QNN53582.1 PTS sugar transporter subunit IIA [Nocardioides mesophilus]
MSEAANHLLTDEAIVLDGPGATRDEAITAAGQLLVAAGAVEPWYVDAMHERERSVSTYMGNLLAIPHGTLAAKSAIRRTAISFTRYPQTVDWDGNPVEFVIAIAGAGDDHLHLLSQLSGVFTDDDQIQQLRTAPTRSQVCAILEGG